LAARLIAAGESLHRQPKRGRPAAGGARELLSVRPYKITYVVTASTVRILEVRHTARLPFD
jgi:plasmid stabilization system protein ParE